MSHRSYVEQKRSTFRNTNSNQHWSYLDSSAAYVRNSGGGQLDEWKWDCRRLMLLDVSMCLVVLFSDFGINTDPKILCPEDLFQADHELQHLHSYYCAAALADHFQASGRRISATTVRNRLHKFCVRSPQRTTAKTAYVGQENMFLGRSNSFCAVQNVSRFTMEVIQGVY
ncbi:HTH_Tnp_Tc3_2 domain-containing protein [Trichonephila clavipes]|nr:HTH_Tnp_Tc3_2 domain-containing protein [Trichonephila clavipes]